MSLGKRRHIGLCKRCAGRSSHVAAVEHPMHSAARTYRRCMCFRLARHIDNLLAASDMSFHSATGRERGVR